MGVGGVWGVGWGETLTPASRSNCYLVWLKKKKKSTFESRENEAVRVAILDQVCEVTNASGICGSRVYLRHVLSVLHWQKFPRRSNSKQKKKKKKKYFCCININITTIGNLQMELFARCLRFQANVRLRLWSPTRMYTKKGELLGLPWSQHGGSCD